MELTAAMLRPFVDGQFEVQNRRRRYIICGEIEAISMQRHRGITMLVITPRWMAEGRGYPPRATSWRAIINILYRANPLLYTASDTGGGRIRLLSDFTGESTTLYPKGQSVLNRSDVEGLS
jgi:hypothetical protein